MFPELPDPLTCDWRDPESVDALLDKLDGEESEMYDPMWNEHTGTYDIEIYL